MAVDERTKQALRDICAGKTVSMAVQNYTGGCNIGMEEIPICGFKWWEDGQQYESDQDEYSDFDFQTFIFHGLK